jgi:hypothetical protein
MDIKTTLGSFKRIVDDHNKTTKKWNGETLSSVEMSQRFAAAIRDRKQLDAMTPELRASLALHLQKCQKSWAKRGRKQEREQTRRQKNLDFLS